MKIKNGRLSTCLAGTLALCGAFELYAQPTAFTYQGRLNDGGNPANGTYDLRFTIYDTASGGGVQGGPLTNATTSVSNGLFTVSLDFGATPFNGSDRWMEIGVRPGDDTGDYANLVPRQPLTATPYAVLAANATSFTGAIADGQLSANIPRLDANQTFSGAVNLSNAANGFTGNGSGLTSLNASQLTGGTLPDARLSANVARLNASQTFSGVNTLSNAANSFAGNGAGLTNLNATNVTGTLGTAQIPNLDAAKITSGALADARLSANIARLNANQTFSGTVNFSGGANNFSGSFTGNGAGMTNVPGAIPAQTGAGASVLAQPNTAYEATNATQVLVTLPTNASLGDVVRVFGLGAGGWRVEPGAGQVINGALAGVVWTARESTRNWNSVASSADGSKLVATVAGGQIYTSTDRGANWTAREANHDWLSVASSADGNRLVAVDNSGQIYTSTDSGTNWTARESIRQWDSVASSADGNRLVAVVNGGQIYTSTDGGTNWTVREHIDNWQSVASSADGNRLVAVIKNGQIYTSTDGGTNWNLREYNRNWQSVASSADGNRLVAVVNGGQIYTSDDGGTRWDWTAREYNRNWQSVASSADGNRLVAVVNGGQIYTSTDGGMNWTARESSRNWLSVASAADGNRLVAGVSFGQIYTSIRALTGVQGSKIELQYAGNGVWQPLDVTQSANTPNTAVGRDAYGAFAAGNITATALSWSSGGSLSDNQGGSIELGNSSSPGVTPFIDFHYGTGAVQDYNVRLMNDLDGLLTLFGDLGVTGTLTGNGSGLTSLNAMNLTGTIGDALLSANVSLLNANQTFTGQNTFSNSVAGGGITLDASSAAGAFNLKNASGLRSSFGLATVAGNYSSDAATGDTVLRASAGKLLLQYGPGASAMAISSNNFVGIGTNSPATALHVASVSDVEISVQSTDPGGRRWTVQSSGASAPALTGSFQIIDRTAVASRLLIDTSGNVGIGNTGPTNKLHVNGGVSATAFVTTSDRNAKENFAPVSPQEVLSKVAALPITTWNFKTMNDGRHMGPMAQDFRAAFGLGGGDTTITSIDPDGVALAAIQGLNQKLESGKQKAEIQIQELKEENAGLKARLEKLERLMIEKNGGVK